MLRQKYGTSWKQIADQMGTRRAAADVRQRFSTLEINLNDPGPSGQYAREILENARRKINFASDDYDLDLAEPESPPSPVPFPAQSPSPPPHADSIFSGGRTSTGVLPLSAAAVDAPPKRKRGRPRKHPKPEPIIAPSDQTDEEDDDIDELVTAHIGYVENGAEYTQTETPMFPPVVPIEAMRVEPLPEQAGAPYSPLPLVFWDGCLKKNRLFLFRH